MPKLTVIAHTHANPDKVDLVRSELQKLIPVTLSESGCLQYDLHEDNEDPTHFLFVETWESRELWQAHMGAPHLAAYGEATEGAIGSFSLYEMTRLG